MGKRLIPRKRRTANRSSTSPDAADFGLDIESTGSGDVSDVDGELHESVEPDDGDGREAFVDPATSSTISGEGGDSDRPRTRRAYTKRNAGKSKRGKSAADSSVVAPILFSMHMMMASFTKTPELVINPDEAAKMADAIERVQSCYEIPMLTETQLAWINLTMACGAIYGPRFVAASYRHSQERKTRRAPTAMPGPVIVPQKNDPVREWTENVTGGVVESNGSD